MTKKYPLPSSGGEYVIRDGVLVRADAAATAPQPTATAEPDDVSADDVADATPTDINSRRKRNKE